MLAAKHTFMYVYVLEIYVYVFLLLDSTGVLHMCKFHQPTACVFSCVYIRDMKREKKKILQSRCDVYFCGVVSACSVEGLHSPDRAV